MPESTRRTAVIAALGTTQTLAWASSYYLPAILADPIAADIGVARTWVFGAFSASLLVSAAIGPAVGRTIDRHGGRGVLASSNLMLAAGLAVLSACNGVAMLAAAWVLLGIGMGLGLYDVAFATLAVLYGRDARGPITGITLMAGFASTVGWPLSAFLDFEIGWRAACLVWAGMHLVIGLPLNLVLIPKGARQSVQQDISRASWQPRREMLLLAYVFAAGWFVTGAMAAHLPTLLQVMGSTAVQAIAASALVGPAQVAARLAEFVMMRRVHPLVSARIAASMHPLAALLLGIVGAPAASAFALLHGGGNGLLTIARGTVPLALFGPLGYGARTGLLGAPARAAQAAAPLLFGLLLDLMGGGVLVISGGLCVSALVALLLLKARPRAVPEADAEPPLGGLER
jgi:predicted MFS family arabinose efflux permease